MARPSLNSTDPGPEAPKPKLTLENLRKSLWIFGYLRPYQGMFVPAVLAVLVTSVLSMIFPILLGNLVGQAMAPEAVLAEANRVAGIMVVILAVQAAITFARMHLLGRSGEKAVADIRRDAYRRLVRLPMTFYSERRVGEVSSRLAADLSLIRDTLVTVTPQFLRQCVMLSAGLVYLFVLSPKLAFFMLGCLPAVLIFIAAFGFRIRGSSRDAQDHLAETNVVIDETLHGIADVKAFANEEYETKRYESGLRKYLDASFKLIGGRAFMVSFIILALFGAVTLIVWFGAHMLVKGEIKREVFTTFCFVTAFVAGAFVALPEIVSEIQKAIGATDRLRSLLDEAPETDQSGGASTPAAHAKGVVKFQDVQFRYPSRPEAAVLKGVSFTAEAGQRIALVGPSGAGKSTVISLLLRFFDPVEGAVLLDGQDVRAYPLGWLRRQMALVPQEVLLFGGSIRENIGYGNPAAGQDAIIQAAKRANAHEFISGFSEGYETKVGERGVKLSGGQKQRIAIARAILADPAVLILDEATSSLDAESERLVQEALDDLMRNRTSLIIAHRLSTVRTADRILVLNEGRIVQQGKHEELLQDTDGLYRVLSQLQLGLK